MDPWVLWLIAAVVLAVGEIATLGFFLAPFAGGAAVAALLAPRGRGRDDRVGGVPRRLDRPARRAAPDRPRPPAQRRALKMGTAALVGQTAMVVERIANDEGVGCVKLDGEIWTARAYDDDEVIEPGTRVQVLEIRGATALVSE